MISIIIPNYNGNKYLKECLDSVYAQSFKDFELIIIDNASTDGSYEWLMAYPDIQFKRLDQNYGFSRAVNEGIYLAKGEYVLLLNNDTIMKKDFLEEILKEMQSHPKAFAVCSKMIQYHNPELIDDAGDEYTLMGWTRKRGDGESVLRYTRSEAVFSACAGAALYRRAVFEEIGYFDESFFAYMEDVDISYRARIYGYQNRYCASAKIHHIGSATSGSRYNEFKVRLAARNNIYVPYKNMPTVQLVLNSPFLMLGYIIKYLFFVKKGLGKAYKEGIIEGIKKVKYVKRIPFKWTHIRHYIYIEGMLIKNTIKLGVSKIKNK
nr:glycosyltransferase family 2 protein [uncultured Cellulosilyticum sp.]